MRTASFLRPDSTHSVPSAGVGEIDVHVFEPKIISHGGGGGTTTTTPIRGTMVTVHPWSVLGGGEHNTLGIARHITANNSNANAGGGGWRVITFALKSSGAVWGILSAHSHEVNQVVDVVDWANQKYGTMTTTTTKTEEEEEEATQRHHHHPVVLLGSSAGAPIAGTAMARLLKRGYQHGEEREEQQNNDGKKRLSISAYVAVGYTFGNFASLGFGRHFSGVMGKKKSSSSSHNNVLFGMMPASSSSPGEEDPAAAAINSPPKLFIMGERDEFTSVAQLEKMASKMRASSGDDHAVVVDVEVVADVGHFELESSSYDPIVAKMVLEWLDKVLQ